ncbi:MAG TPA: AAA family ATPase, partial [bacterium]|nr:AAA family ATPase [bacterium]
MIYVFAELRNYRQLVRLRAEALPSVETSLATALGTLSSPPRPAGPGSWIAEAGPEGELEAAPVAGAAWQARTVLAERERELFGFAVLIVSLPAALSDAERAGRAAALLETVEDEAALWVAPDCAALFGDSLALQAAGPLYRAVAPRRPEGRTEAGHARAPHPWTREGLVTRALDLIAPRLNLGESKEVLWVHGPAGAGKTALLRELAARLQHEGSVPALRTRTIFRRRSPLHPFLHSLAPSLLARIVPALRGPELAVWDDVGPLLMW